MSKLKNRLERRKDAVEPDRTETAASSPEPTSEPNGPSDRSPRSAIIDQLRERMNKVAARHAVRTTADKEIIESAAPPQETRRVVPLVNRVLPGAVLDTSMGEVWINRQDFDIDYCHGDIPVRGFLKTGPGLGALCRDDRIAALDPLGALFIDTETTGLSGGTGTLPFLIGVGWFNPEGTFSVEHLFCREPDEEPAQLERLCEHLRRATHLVSFNGRSFDLPLINTRFIINRTRNPAVGIPHLDLLHVSRRIFSRRLSDRSLGNLEQVIMNFHRVDDIPGSEIPAVYSDYLRGGPADQIVSIFDHNTFDIVALAALGGVLEQMYTDPEAVAHVADHLGLAKSAFFVGHGDRGFAHLNRADVAATVDGSDRQDALHLLARHAAKRGDFATAEKTWLQLVQLFPDDSAAHLALAKHYERREKNYDRALRHARQTAEAEGEEACAHRVARIERRLEKQLPDK